MTRRRKAAYIAGGFAGLLLLLGLAGVVVLRSPWFADQVRARLVAEVEKATGGRAEAARFAFDWSTLTAEVRGFVLHGTEPAGAAPLLRIETLRVGLKIVSLAKRDIDLALVEIRQPHAHLIIGPDGSTNIPEPKIKRESKDDPIQTLLDLAIQRFQLSDGLIAVDGRGETPFAVNGENLRARFDYELGGPRYRGEVSMQPIRVRLENRDPAPLNFAASLVMERNRVEVTRATLSGLGSEVRLSGVITDLRNPRADIRYGASLGVGPLAQWFGVEGDPRGAVNATGTAAYRGANDYTAAAQVDASGLAYRSGRIRVRGTRATGSITASPSGVDLSGLRIAGTLTAPTGEKLQDFPITARVAAARYRDGAASLEGLNLTAMGGTFTGRAALDAQQRFEVRGDAAGFSIGRLFALASPKPAPWDGAVSGPLRISGSANNMARTLRAEADLKIAPSAAGAPVQGELHARYDARTGAIDLGRSTLSLPSTRLDVSGSTASRLDVHFETRDLNDLLPVLDKMPVALRNGFARFDGTVTGTVKEPRIEGALTAKNLVYEEREIDSVTARITASPQSAAVTGGEIVEGAIRAQLSGSLQLREWKPFDAAALNAQLTVARAPIADALLLAGQRNLELTGTATVNARATGTYRDPRVEADVVALKGVAAGEPFDRISARLVYTPGEARLLAGSWVAGGRRINATAVATHPRDSFDSARVEFLVNSNTMRLDQFQMLVKARPGVRGTVAATTRGAATWRRNATPAVRVEYIDGVVNALGLGLGEQAIGNARLTAETRSGAVHARLESNFANSRVSGEGAWKLTGDYPGSATLRIPQLDFVQLREWLAPADADRFQVGGSAEAEATLAGPLMKPEEWRVALVIPKIEIRPAPTNEALARRGGYVLSNQGPIRIVMEKSVARIENLRLAGRSTDLSLTGTAALRNGRGLDLRARGQIDLGILQTYFDDIYSSGKVALDAAVKGPMDQPQLTGKLDLKDASLSVPGSPNSLANANGTIALTGTPAGTRATIQRLTGETGGGKVGITGFASYGQGMMVFRLAAEATEVRVRYPEGVSTVANAKLNLTGSTQRSQLDGTITILRTGFNPRSDLSSVLAGAAEPPKTPAARSGLLANMNLDVAIETSPDISFQSALTQDLQAEADLRVRGTAAQPALLGRITVSRGEILFFGTRYNINQGSISFYNPTKIEPVLNVDLETRARGVDVTLTVSGPVDKLNVTHRSDPPLQFSEIIALLATGRAPTSDPALAARQQQAPQTWQQMGASALVGQAIANPVAGRLQRFFGVSRLKIDPSLTGVANNPQARLTLEQQITRDITFTYITNVTNSNPQVIRVEWAVNRQWSVIAVREENGLFGLDFLYKKRF